MKSSITFEAAENAYWAFAAMQREEARHPELSRNPYWRADKQAAQARYRSLLEKA